MDDNPYIAGRRYGQNNMGQVQSHAENGEEWDGLVPQAKEILQRRITDQGWQQRDIPDALSAIPEYMNVSDELRNILQWSLLRYEPRVVPPARTHSPDLPEVVTAEHEQQIVEEQQARHAAETETVDSRSSLKYDGSENSSRSAQHSIRVRPLFAKLKKLRQDVATKMASKAQYQDTPPSEPEIPAQSEVRECISCFDEFSPDQTVHLECSHDYCKPCAAEVIKNAMKTESAFPPKCCLTEIPLKTVLLCLDKTEREEYQEKSAEYAIPAGHRWYCPEPKCAKWIRPEKLHRQRRSQQTCPHCKTKFCSICRGLAHDENADCPQDFGLDATLEVAESEGWRRCYSCRTMVELTIGCRHITCTCGAEFCYVCSARWRTCHCTEADKDRKIAEARIRREQREQRERQNEERQQQEADAAEAAEAEAAEIAEAIRQVEEMERLEAEREAEREATRQLEEELALARLEEQRLIEEIERRQREEEAHARFRAVLIESSRVECEMVSEQLMQIIDYQRAALNSSHNEQYVTLERDALASQQSALQSLEESRAWLQENIHFRESKLVENHSNQLEALRAKFEDEEDELFMQMQLYFKDKPNRERREKSMRDTLVNQQKQKQEDLEAGHKQELEKFHFTVDFELEGIRRATEVKSVESETSRQRDLTLLGSTIGGDRKIFELVTRRRVALMAAHAEAVMNSISIDEDPTGLTEEQASEVRPILPALNGLYWQSMSFDRDESSDMYGPAQSYGGSETDSIAVPGRSDTLRVPGSFPTERAEVSPVSNRTSLGVDTPSASERTSVHEAESREPEPREPEPREPAQTYLALTPTVRNEDEILPAPVAHQQYSTAATTPGVTASTIALPQRPAHVSISSSSTVNTMESIDSSGRRMSSRTSMSIDTKRESTEKKKGAFSRMFGKKELTDEEIRRRMMGAAGDGFGG